MAYCAFSITAYAFSMTVLAVSMSAKTISPSQYLHDQEFEVVRIVLPPDDGMVCGLCVEDDLSDFALGILGGHLDDV